MKKKMMVTVLALVIALVTLTGCGSKNAQQSVNLEGSCEDILAKVYENAELDEELRGAMEYYQTVAIDESMEEYVLGTDDVDYTDSVYSAPMMTSVAYQCVVLRLEADENIEEVKQKLVDSTDTNKWVCVEAESVVVENVGDVVLYVMADAKTADAIKTAFLALGES